MNLCCIGVDSGHLPAFTRLINQRNEAGTTTCRVTNYFDDGANDWVQGEKSRKANVPTWISEAQQAGAQPLNSLKEALAACDGFLVLNVSGKRHFAHGVKCLKTGKPTYIDKPLTCDAAQARRLLALSRRHKAPCYSASSLRFIAELSQVDFAALGPIAAIDAYGPGELLKADPDLWHYGCHSVELVDSIFARSGQGAGVKRVSAVAMPDRHLLDLEYRDGRYARIRLERKGCWEFGATIHGQKASHQFKVQFDGAAIYDRLIAGMTGFFEGKPAPVALRDIVENVAVMAMGNKSIKKKGAWVAVPAIK